MIKFVSLAGDFEKVIKKILKQNGFETYLSAGNKYDLQALYHGTACYVEVKLYRNKLPNLDLLKTACLQLLSQKDNNDNAALILVVSSYVTPSLKKELLKEYGVIIWDIKSLFSLAFEYNDTYYELADILIRAFNTSVDEYTIPDPDNTKEQNLSLITQTRPNNKSSPLINEGKKLYDELNAISVGKEGATAYENKCIELLRYLFPETLTLWEKQCSSEDGLNRYDLLCRINSGSNSFWTELAHDFHTRYVVFEFKNYTDPIKQGQIFTTEKYLFLTALRSVSFIIARNGADENAIKATKGALKETGKLIVILTNDDLDKMLTYRDTGGEASWLLQEKVDNMLITLNR